MDNPGDAKYGMSEAQMVEAFTRLAAAGAKTFGIHAFLASNTVTNEYYPQLATQLFELAVRVSKAAGVHVAYVNLSGGIGVDYRPDQPANDIAVIGDGVRAAYERILVPAGMGDVAILTELGRFMLAPFGALVTTAITRSISTRSTSAWTPAPPTSCARPCTAPTTTSPCLARRMPPATTSTT